MIPKLSLTLALVSLAVPSCLVAQQGPPPPMQGPGEHGRGPMGAGFDEHGRGGGGLGLPHGMWWKSPELVSQLSLTSDQQKRMDDILRKNRIKLIDVKASLEKEQLNLEPLVNAATLDQPRTLAEVSKIADLRADLEKTEASMLVELRGVLTADQWTKLHAMGKARHDHPEAGRPAGAHGPQGQPGAAAPPPVGDAQ